LGDTLGGFGRGTYIVFSGDIFSTVLKLGFSRDIIYHRTDLDSEFGYYFGTLSVTALQVILMKRTKMAATAVPTKHISLETVSDLDSVIFFNLSDGRAHSFNSFDRVGRKLWAEAFISWGVEFSFNSFLNHLFFDFILFGMNFLDEFFMHFGEILLFVLFVSEDSVNGVIEKFFFIDGLFFFHHNGRFGIFFFLLNLEHFF